MIYLSLALHTSISSYFPAVQKRVNDSIILAEDRHFPFTLDPEGMWGMCRR
jgi:hypothetical protein